MEVPLEPWPNVVDGVGDRGLKGGALRWCWTAEAASARVLPGKPASSLCSFVVSALALLWLSWASVLPWFTSPVLLGATVGAAPTARAQVKGYKSAPLLLYTDRSPRAWATHKRDTLLGRAQNDARAGGAVFTAVKLFVRCASHDPRAAWRSVEGCA